MKRFIPLMLVCLFLMGATGDQDPSFGKSAANVAGTVTTTATTADQVIATYTVTVLKKLYIQHVDIGAHLSTLTTTPTLLGKVSLEVPSGTKRCSWNVVQGADGKVDFINLDFSDPFPLNSGLVVRLVVTPAITTSTVWDANILGFER